ncbi:MAG: radical SAM protein [candidate division WOR-3 bacterium]
MKRAFLFNPPTGLYIRGEDRCQVPVEDLTATSARMPLDLAYIGADLERTGLDVLIRDYPVEGGDPVADALEFRPDIALASTTSFTLRKDLQWLERLKGHIPGLLVGVKGAEAEAEDRRLLEEFPFLDFVLVGEYELTMGKMVAEPDWQRVPGVSFRKNGVIFVSEKEPIIEDLDSLPFPARHLIRNELYVRPDTGQPQTTIQTGRGCPHKCIYCLAPLLSGTKLRLRSPESLGEEIAECVEVHGIRNFFTRADTFTMHKKWTIDVCKEILKRSLRINFAFNSRVDTFDRERAEWIKKAGGWLVAFGVESGSERSLRLMEKGHTKEDARRAVALAKELGFATYIFFIVGFPWEDWNDLEETLAFAMELDGDYLEMHIAVPFPGTPLYEMVKDKGLLVHQDLTGLGHGTPAARTEHLSLDEIKTWRERALRRYYTRPGYIWRMIRGAKSPRVVANYIRYGFRRVLRRG